MKAWKPEVPKCPIAAAMADAKSRKEAAEDTRLHNRDAFNQAKIDVANARDRERRSSIEYSNSNKALGEVSAEAKALEDKAALRLTYLRTSIETCEGIIEDILHYTELYSLPAGKAARMNKVLREALRNKRVLQDEQALIQGARRDLSGLPVTNPVYKNGSYKYHVSRLNSTRTYHPRQVTLAEVLNLQAVPATQAPARASQNPSRFSHIRSTSK